MINSKYVEDTMWSEFVGIIKAVKCREPESEALLMAVLACKEYHEVDGILEDMEPEEKSPGDCREYRAIFTLCKACVYCESNLKLALDTASDEALHAIEGFRCCGNSFNEGLSYRVLGIIYSKHDKKNLSLSEFNRAVKIFKQCAELYESEQNFNRVAECKQQIHDCDKAIQEIKGIKAPSTSDSQPHHTRDNWIQWPPAHIIYQIHDFGHASRVGKYVFDDEPIGEVTIDEIMINGELHKLFSTQFTTPELTLTAGNDYRWLCVTGDSMNNASPTPIESGDYVLADLNRKANNGDIVIAKLLDPPTPTERAGVIKRLAEHSLRSESNEKIDAIPLVEAKVRGVVIAIAKAGEKHSTPIEESIGRTKPKTNNKITETSNPINPEKAEGEASKAIEEELFNKLLMMLGVAGTNEQARRLIDQERKHKPGISQIVAMRMAIVRLERERQ
jgi:hypothetical protein